MAIKLGFLYQGVTYFDLLGGDAGIRGCQRRAETANTGSSRWGEVTHERIEVLLEGSGIETNLLGLEGLLELASRSTNRNDGVFLRYYQPGGPDWRSRVACGWVEQGLTTWVDRSQGAQVVILHITRVDYWAAPLELASAGFLPTTPEGSVIPPQFANIASCQDATHKLHHRAGYQCLRQRGLGPAQPAQSHSDLRRARHRPGDPD